MGLTAGCGKSDQFPARMCGLTSGFNNISAAARMGNHVNSLDSFSVIDELYVRTIREELVVDCRRRGQLDHAARFHRISSRPIE